MGVLIKINRLFNEVEEQLGFFICNNSAIENTEISGELVTKVQYTWVKLKPNEAHMQTCVLSDYQRLVGLCTLMLKNVNSKYISRFEQSSEIVLAFIRQNTLILFRSLEEVFEQIQQELNIQRSIIIQTYQ